MLSIIDGLLYYCHTLVYHTHFIARLLFLANPVDPEMADVEGIKSFLYSWLQQNLRKSPEYTFIQRPAGRGRIRFICEVTLLFFCILKSATLIHLIMSELGILLTKKTPRLTRLEISLIFWFVMVVCKSLRSQMYR